MLWYAKWTWVVFDGVIVVFDVVIISNKNIIKIQKSSKTQNPVECQSTETRLSRLNGIWKCHSFLSCREFYKLVGQLKTLDLLMSLLSSLHSSHMYSIRHICVHVCVVSLPRFSRLSSPKPQTWNGALRMRPLTLFPLIVTNSELPLSPFPSC